MGVGISYESSGTTEESVNAKGEKNSRSDYHTKFEAKIDALEPAVSWMLGGNTRVDLVISLKKCDRCSIF